MQLLERIFKLRENGTSVKIELIAGLTTFMTMAYILIVSPNILSATGMDKGALITATALSAAFATFLMAFLANLPFALAPGMGINAFFAYGICLGMGYSWQVALTAVLVEGIIFIALTALNVREALIDAIPDSMKKAITVGIGLFITLIGLVSTGIVKTGMSHVGEGKLSGIVVTLGDLKAPGPIIALVGLVVMGALMQKKVKGAVLFGILASTVLGIPFGVTDISGGIFGMPASIAPIMFKFDFTKLLSIDMAIILFTLLFVDMFDTIGTLVGVTMKAGMMTKDGKVPRAKQALFADAVGTTAGAFLGTSTVTSYIESATGVQAGGRTGLTSFTVGVLFLVALIFTPLFLIIPASATGPALIMVGLFMLSPIKDIDLDDYTEALPAFITMVLMPLTYSIANGIALGMLTYLALKILTGKYKEPSILSYLLGLLFIIKFAI
ncbi:MAG: NCS2 family permease [Bacteriovoracaceae bacterium]|nr:NCS2 family permease [Bacteriovoracaceae bacterium]